MKTKLVRTRRGRGASCGALPAATLDPRSASVCGSTAANWMSYAPLVWSLHAIASVSLSPANHGHPSTLFAATGAGPVTASDDGSTVATSTPACPFDTSIHVTAARPPGACARTGRACVEFVEAIDASLPMGVASEESTCATTDCPAVPSCQTTRYPFAVCSRLGKSLRAGVSATAVGAPMTLPLVAILTT